jgi:hypothetical protein
VLRFTKAMNRFPLPTVTFVLIFACVAGCNGNYSPSEPALPDTISLTSVTPADGTRVAPGSTLTVSGTVRYQLGSSSSGNILLVFEDQNGSPLLDGPRQSVPIQRGQGTVSISDTLVVPQLATGATEVAVLFAVAPDGAIATNTIALVTYPIGS